MAGEEHRAEVAQENVLKIDTLEYQRLQREIEMRMQMRSGQINVVVAVAGFVAFLLGPGLGVLLAQDTLLRLAVLLSVTVAMSYLSIILFYEMLNHGHYVGLAASYMHSVLRPRIVQTIEMMDGASVSKLLSTQQYGLLAWENFTADRIGKRWPTRPGSFVLRWAIFLIQRDIWIRGEAIPIFIAIIASLVGIVLGVSNFDLFYECKFRASVSCPHTAILDQSFYATTLFVIYALVALSVLSLILVANGIRVSRKVSAEYDNIANPPKGAMEPVRVL